MWQPEVMGVLPARGLHVKGSYFVARHIHIKRATPVPDAPSSHWNAVTYVNKPYDICRKK